MGSEIDKTENLITNPMEYDFGEISTISKVINGNFNSDEILNNENNLSINEEAVPAFKANVHTKPIFFKDELWSEFQSLFPWLYHSGKKFYCEYCEYAYKHSKGMVATNWIPGSLDTVTVDAVNQYNNSRRRFRRHSKTVNHLFAVNVLKPSVPSKWQSLKMKYDWLEGDMDNTRCLYCEEAYKKHKTIMIVTIWTCPELKNQQSPSHFSVEHRLDRHEKCKNHLLAVQLHTGAHKIKSLISSSSTTETPNAPIKPQNKFMKRNRKSAAVKSVKADDIILPTFISKEHYRTLRLRYPWMESCDRTSFMCSSCPKNDCKIVFDSNSSLSLISRKILAHCSTDVHKGSNKPHSETTCVTRLQRGIVHKIDYKRLSNGMDDVTTLIISGTPKRPTRRWSCPQCKSSFIRIHSLMEHISVCDYQSTNISRELSCPCKSDLYNFNTITKLDLHASQDHPNQRLFNCYLCSDRFCRVLTLFDHMIVHHLIEWDPFETYMSTNAPLVSDTCIFCCTIFKSNLDLTIHYSISKCNNYLQPTVKIEQIDVSHLNQFENITETTTKKTQRYINYPKKRETKTLNLQLLDQETEKNETDTTITFSQILSDLVSPIEDEELKKSTRDETKYDNPTDVINVSCVSTINSPDRKDKKEINKTMLIKEKKHEDIQLKWLPKNKHCINLFSKTITDSSAKTENNASKISNQKSMQNIRSRTRSRGSSHKSDDLSTLPSQKTTTVSSKTEITDKNFRHLYNRRNCKSIFSRRLPENDDVISKKTVKNLTKKNRKDLSSKRSTKIEKIIKSPEIIKQIKKSDRNISMKKNLKSRKKIPNEILADEILADEILADESNDRPTEPSKSLTPEKKVKSLYLDKLKEMMNWEVLEDKIKISDSLPDTSSALSRDISKSPDKSSLVQNVCTEVVTIPVDSLSLKTNRRSLIIDTLSGMDTIKDGDVMTLITSTEEPIKETIHLDTTINERDGVSISDENLLSPNKSKQVSCLDISAANFKESYEIISLNDEESTSKINDVGTHNSDKENKKSLLCDSAVSTEKLVSSHDSISNEVIDTTNSESHLLNYEDKSLDECCQGITLSELKVCIEKTDLVEAQKRLKDMIEKRKRISMDRLHENLSSSVTSMEHEKRVRIPTEKLRESANYFENRRRKPSITTETKTYKVESVVATSEVKTNKKETPIVKMNKVDEAVKLRNIRKKQASRGDYLLNATRKRKFVHRVRQPRIETQKESKEYTVKSENRLHSAKFEERVVPSPHVAQPKFPKLTNLLIEVEEDVSAISPDSTKGKKPIMIQSQLSPPSKSMTGDIQDEQNISGELSFMDRMKKIRQLKKIRTEQQREQMMAVDKTVAEINEKAMKDASIQAKSEKIKKLLTCEQYSMDDLKNILHDECEKRKLSDPVVTENVAKSQPIKQYSMTELKNILQDECKKRKLSESDENRSPKKQRLEKNEMPSNPRSTEAQAGHLICEICHMTFRSLRARDKHVVEEHKGLKLFKCNVCELSLTTHLSLRKHANRHHPDSVAAIMSGTDGNTPKTPYFQCHFCSVQCISKTGLQNHITSVHRTTQSKHRSSNEGDLPVSFPVVVVDNFVAKLKNANPANNYQECPVCIEMVNNEFELAIHTVEHERENDSNLEANQFACPKCCRLFFGREGKTYLKDHYNIIHLQKPVPSCDECGTEFPSTWCYYEHKRTQRNCAKTSATDMVLATDPYEPLNDPMRLAFVCSRCQALVAGDSAQKRFEEHQVECSLQMTDMDGGGGDGEEAEDGEESLVVDDSGVTVMAVGGTLVSRDH